jgi:hypothetical protein
MAFYLRNSLRVGPIRFNLSKSGIGVSAGIRGLRLGTGPRGNYIHMGRHGLYYRATLPSGGTPGKATSPPGSASGGPGERSIEAEPLREIESGDVSQMRDSSSTDLLAEFDAKRKKVRLAPVVAVLGIALVVGLLSANVPSWVPVLALIVALLGFAAARVRDQLKKTVVLFYELEHDSERDYQGLHDAFDALKSCARTWHVKAKRDVTDWKRNAGAGSFVQKKPISLSKSAPPFVKTNIEIPAVPVGRQTLYLFPDRILVFEPDGVRAVAYSDLAVDRRATRYIASGSVPGDATIVDRTWQYVNKNGGPDRRFNNNREIPIAL